MKPDDLILDMESRFTNGQIRSLTEYISLLKEHKNDGARIKVMREYALFDRCMNYCLVDAETNLKARELKNILKDYVKEYPAERNILSIRERIN